MGKSTLKAGEISSIIKKELTGFHAEVEAVDVGTVMQVGDGVARIFGLQNAMAGELVEFPHNVGFVCSVRIRPLFDSARSNSLVRAIVFFIVESFRIQTDDFAAVTHVPQPFTVYDRRRTNPLQRPIMLPAGR